MNAIPDVKELTAQFLSPSGGGGAGGFDIASILGGGSPLEAIGGTATSQADAGAGQQNSSGSNFINVGNPIQNIGAILQQLNSGPATSGGFPTSFSSPIARVNSRGILPSRLGLRGEDRPGFSTPIILLGGVALISGAIFLARRRAS